MTAFQPVFKGLLIGLGAAMPLGPVNVEIARRTLRNGFAAGFWLGAGACSIDVMYAVLTTFSVGRVLHVQWVYWPLSIGAVLLLSYLGAMCLRSAFQTRPIADGEANDPLLTAGSEPASMNTQLRKGIAANLYRSYLTGLLMTLLNPMTIAFWFVALPGIAGQLQQRALPLVCAGVFTGTIAWVIAFSGTLSVIGKFNRSNWMKATDAIGGLMLIGFAITVLWHAAHTLG